MTAPIGKSAIAGLIPHDGAMCLLDAVIDWSATAITCRASSHRDAANPMAVEGQLAGLCGIEYAAQAMAIHGSLVTGAGPRPTAGYLASVRDVVCLVDRLDLLAGDLVVTASLLLAEAGRVIYGFDLRCNDETILRGRAALVLDIGPPIVDQPAGPPIADQPA